MEDMAVVDSEADMEVDMAVVLEAVTAVDTEGEEEEEVDTVVVLEVDLEEATIIILALAVMATVYRLVLAAGKRRIIVN